MADLKLTKTQAHLIWHIISWFTIIPRKVPFRIMADLYKIGKVGETIDKELERDVMRRIVETGNYIQQRHPEWIS